MGFNLSRTRTSAVTRRYQDATIIEERATELVFAERKSRISLNDIHHLVKLAKDRTMLYVNLEMKLRRILDIYKGELIIG